MHCIDMGGLGCLQLIVSPSGKVRRTILRPNQRGLRGGDELSELVSSFLDGKLGPESLMDHLEIMPGLLGMAQLAMLAIPRGKVSTYSQIASLIGTSPRAMGKLASMNELPVLVPCHRIVRSNGELGGYSMGIEVKRKLLAMENVVINEGVDREYLVDDSELLSRFHRLLRLRTSSQGE